MQKEITCTECANHCSLTVEQKGEEIVVTGNRCPRGLKSGTEEFLGQRQVVRGFVRSSVEGVGKIPVHTSKSVPKGMVYKVTLALKRVCGASGLPGRNCGGKYQQYRRELNRQ